MIPQAAMIVTYIADWNIATLPYSPLVIKREETL